MEKVLFNGKLRIVDANSIMSWRCDIDMGEIGDFIIEEKVYEEDDLGYKREIEYLGWINYYDEVGFQGDYYDSYDYRLDYHNWTVEAYWWNKEEPFVYLSEDLSIEDIEDIIAEFEGTTYEDVVPILKMYIRMLRR